MMKCPKRMILKAATMSSVVGEKRQSCVLAGAARRLKGHHRGKLWGEPT